jgi:hypothetical protein
MKQVKPEKLVFYTSAGREIEFEPISPILMEEAEQGLVAEYRQRGEPLDKPTYTVETAGGGSQTFEHDETTLTTDEMKATWEAHKDANARLAAEQGDLRIDMVLSALKVDLPADDDWERRLRKWHVTIPDDPDEKWKFFVLREVLKTPSDIFEAMTAVISASMRGTVPEEAIEAASATFRSGVQEAAREKGFEFGGNQESTVKQPGQPGELGA